MTQKPTYLASEQKTFQGMQEGTPGHIVILNGTPRSGKSSIAIVIQNTFEGVWKIRQTLTDFKVKRER